MTEAMPIPVPVPPTDRPAMPATTRRKLIEFATIAEVMQFAVMIQDAEGCIPKGYLKNPGKIVAAVMRGHALGIDPMSSLVAFHTVEGRPTAGYDFWVARLKAAGYRVEWTEFTPERVTLRLTSPTGQSEPETWTKDRAIRAGLWNGKDNWKKYPETMLAARCVTSLGRRFAAEVMYGVHTPDEIEEIQQAEYTEAPRTPETVAASASAIAAAVGATVSPEAQQVEALARRCADAAKAAGMTRDDLFAVLDELGIPRSRLSELSMDNLKKLAAQLGIATEIAEETKQ